MDKQQITVGMRPWQFAEKVGELVSRIPRHAIVLFELRPSPTDGFFGTNIESIGIKQGALIMVA